MKKAKIILTSVAFLALIGGTLAFKASKFLPANIWYIPTENGIPQTTQTFTAIDGQLYMTTIINCTKTFKRTTDFGLPITTSSATTSPLVTAVFTKINPVGGAPLSFVTTYHYCTEFFTKTIMADAI